MNRFVCFGLASLVMVLTSCYSTSVATNKEPSYQHSLEKVAIVVDTGSITLWGGTGQLGDYLSAKIHSMISVNGPESKAITQNGLELDEDNAKKQIEAYEPKEILYFQLKQGAASGTLLQSGTFEARVFDTTLNKNVWRAQLTAQPAGFGGFIGTAIADQLVGDLLKALRKDALLQ